MQLEAELRPLGARELRPMATLEAKLAPHDPHPRGVDQGLGRRLGRRRVVPQARLGERRRDKLEFDEVVKLQHAGPMAGSQVRQAGGM